MTKWYCAGLASSFQDIRPTRAAAEDGTKFCLQPEPDQTAECKVFQISPTSDESSGKQFISLAPSEAIPVIGSDSLQVLVFRYRGRFHAIDNTCPHQSFSLCQGTLHDIEDFGILLSAAVTCPKHGWSFDLTTGESSRGRYKLPVWEVDVRAARDVVATDGATGESFKDSENADKREVWVRRRA